MLYYSKAVVYTIIAILVCGVLALWLMNDPSMSNAKLFWMTVGCGGAVSYLLYRHLSCVQRLSFDGDHISMSGRKSIVHGGEEFKMIYRSTFLVFAGFQLILRAWRPETGMIVYRNTTRYIPFMSLFDRIFPASNAKRQVLFFGAWKRSSGEVVPDGEIQQRIESACAREGRTIKNVPIEPELLACATLAGLLLWILFR
jgi:hypothetical protein